MALTTEQLKKIKSDIASAEKALTDATTETNQARRAGIDVTDTDEQIKEFWEWCGLNQVQIINGNCIFVDTKGQTCWLDLDLNNLFKYAPDYQQIMFHREYCGITIDDKLYEGFGETEALALFWAIYEVIK